MDSEVQENKYKYNGFEIIQNIMQTYIDRWEEFRPHYNPWFVNLAISQHTDLLNLANEMNKTSLSKEQQYYFYLYSIPIKYRHYYPWIKKTTKPEELKMICEEYKINPQKASDYYQLLSPEEIKRLRKKHKILQEKL